MNCDQALELLSGHIDQCNTPEEEAQLQAHLASCASCRAVLAAYEELDCGLSALRMEPPASLLQGVMDAVRREEAAKKKIRRFPARGVAATAVAAALLLVVGMTALPALRDNGNSTDAAPHAVSYTAESSTEDPSSLTKAVPDGADAAQPSAASAEVPEENADASDPRTITTQSSGPETSDSTDEAGTPTTLTVVPSTMSVDPPSDAVQAAFPDGQEVPQLLVELMDNPDTPAASNIAELSQLTAEETATDRIVFYACSAGTVRDIVDSYDTVYTFETPVQLDTAADSDACGLLVIQP